MELAALHHAILRSVVDRGFAPSHGELADHFGASEAEVAAGLTALAEDHGAVLHPNSTRPWVVHPFSLAPTAFWVSRGDRGWWSNCAWCSLGVAALVEGDVTVTSTLAGHDRPARLRICGGEVVEGGELLIHFPIPMAKAWDNVLYTCSTMLLFEDEAQVDGWCRRHRMDRGDVRAVGEFWEFAKVWYGNHLSPSWRKWTTAEARGLFARFGLTGPIWELPENDERF